MTRLAAVALLAALVPGVPIRGASSEPIAVDLESFVRAESDLHFGKIVQRSGFGQLEHRRAQPAIGHKDELWLNRDILDSAGVFDLDAAPVQVTLPEAAGRYLALQALSEDHFTVTSGATL